MELIIAITIALTQAVKRAGVDKRYIPFVAILIGTILSVINGYDVTQGIVVGLSAVGLYASAKNTAKHYKIYDQEDKK